MADKLNLDYQDDYEASDSDEGYTKHERNLLRKARKGNKREDSDEEEVFKFDESDSEPEKFEADSDFDEAKQEDDYLPDKRSWGKKKSAFYNTDFQDNDYRTYTEQEEEAVNLEQQEALEIQKRLASELNEADFNLDLFTQSTENHEETSDIKKTKRDLSDLSKKQKLALFKTEAPEFDGLVQDFNDRMTESKDLLIPTMNIFKSIGFPNHPFIDFISSRNDLIMNYCTNISFYLMLKAKRVKVRNHPIVKRLVQFRQLICQLDDLFEYVIKPQIETILREAGDETAQKSTKLNILKDLGSKIENSELNDDQSSSEENGDLSKPLFNQDSDDDKEEMDVDEEKEDGKTKRQITRQIAKNKGLTASKRKELRNPRVKNKLKFNKAVKRRKGAVQPVRSKVELYGGEASGIKAYLKRSTKIK